MNRNDLMHLMAERAALTRMIAETPEEDVIDRASLSIRLEKVERQIKANPLPEREPARAVLTFKGKPVFSDLLQVQRSLARISQDNLLEEEVLQTGQFVGVMPAKKREFEFQLQGNNEVIAGKIGPNITNPAELTAHLCESVQVKLMSTRVGNGKPRYVLTEMPEWTVESAAM